MDDVTAEVTGIQKQIEVTKQMAEDTRQLTEREREIEKRKKNVVIFNAPENAGASGWKEQRDLDLDYVIELTNEVLGESIDRNEIGKIYRLGHRNFNGGEACRPILVEFTQGTTKNLIMHNVNKLRNLEKFKNVVISHDMSKNEREECKKLVEEAKQQESNDTSGEFLYRVRGLPGQLKIVRFRKRF